MNGSVWKRRRSTVRDRSTLKFVLASLNVSCLFEEHSRAWTNSHNVCLLSLSLVWTLGHLFLLSFLVSSIPTSSFLLAVCVFCAGGGSELQIRWNRLLSTRSTVLPGRLFLMRRRRRMDQVEPNTPCLLGLPTDRRRSIQRKRRRRPSYSHSAQGKKTIRLRAKTPPKETGSAPILDSRVPWLVSPTANSLR